MKQLVKLALLVAVAVMMPAATRPNWNNTVTDTPDGWHRLGNPAAKLKLIEFVSYTCPHCAHFEEEGSDALRVGYVASGALSIEVHHVIRDPVDVVAVVLANCGPKEKFFQNQTAILRGQSRWIERVANPSDATRARWSNGTLPVRFRAIAQDAGFYELMQARGYETRQIDACLADSAKAQRLVQQSNASNQQCGIKSTPSFAINGEVVPDAHSWADLKPVLAERVK